MARFGEIIDGKYEILREIGRGGMSIVYLAMDKRLNKQWAIKEFRKDKDDESKRIALESLMKEANIMKKLDHPILPRIVDIIDQDNTVYVVMDYIEGESLNKVLEANGAQPQDAVIEWAKQLSEVLDYLHNRKPPVIYRDMKPANIMLKPDGTIRLIDFGIAREYKEGHTGDTEIIGTRGYAAPEQFGDKGQTDARTDIYSLGVTLYHLITGKNPAEPPYEIYPIRHWNPNLSVGLEWLIQKCVQLNPDDRFQSCTEITYALNNLDKFDPIFKRRLRDKLKWFIASVSATLVCALIGLSMGVVTFNNRANELNRLKQQDTITGYIQAINLDSTDADSYEKLLDKIDKQIDAIYPSELPPGANAEQEHENHLMYLGEIQKAVGGNAMVPLQEKNPVEYAKANYKIGLSILNKYSEKDESGESSKLYNSITYAMPYFGKVIETVKKTGSYVNSGLDEKQYMTSAYYYLLGYFITNESVYNSSQMDEMGKFEASEIVKYLYDSGYDYLKVEQDGTISNFYEAYWELIVRTTLDINTTLTLSPKANLNLISLNSHTFERNKDKFLNKSTNKETVKNLHDAMIGIYRKSEESIKQNVDADTPLEKELKQKLAFAKKSISSLMTTISDWYEKNGDAIDLEALN